jgi:hypothetical protein
VELKAPADRQRHLPQMGPRTQAEMATTKVAVAEAVALVVAVVTRLREAVVDQVVSRR